MMACHITDTAPVSGFRRKKNTLASSPGFTMVETIVALAVLGIFFAAVALILQKVLENVGQSRVRTTALALAQEKMEAIRNLPFASVGTAGGIPQGPLPQQETLVVNSLPFTVTTSIVYIDDPFDGVAPSDLINTDYKRARVEITWGGSYPSRLPVTFVTNIAPKGIETVAGGGTLLIQVIDANGLPVAGATVSVDNTAVTPEIHTQTLTSATGVAVFPGAPACVDCYHISVTKSGYSQARTYSTTEVANPLQPHPTLIEGDITQISFAIDRTSSLTVNAFGSRESGYPPVGNVLFALRGTKIIGYDSLDDPVYKYNVATGTIGNTVLISNLEWDIYTLDFSNSYHLLAGSNPPVPIALTPATAMILPIVTAPKSNTSLLVIVKNAAGLLQASVSAQLTNGLGYDATKFTAATGAADFGQAFFGGLTPTTYGLKVNLPGYQEATASLILSTIHQETITLNAN